MDEHSEKGISIHCSKDIATVTIKVQCIANNLAIPVHSAMAHTFLYGDDRC